MRVQKEINELKAHPRHAELLGGLTASQLQDRARVLEARGQEQPIDVLPDGTVLSGYDDVLAARHLGWRTLEAREHDGREDEEAWQLERLAEDRLRRDHVDPWQRLRSYKHVLETARARTYRHWTDTQRGLFRQELLSRLQWQPRTADRYLRVLWLPDKLQEAFGAGKVTLMAAQRVAALPPDIQEQVADRVGQGSPLAKAIEQFVGKPSGRHKRVGHAFASFVRELGRGLDDLEDRADHIRRVGPDQRAVLERARRLIEQLLLRPPPVAEQAA